MDSNTLAFLARCWNVPAPSSLVVLGGGRWGRVWLRVARSIMNPSGRVTIASRANTAKLRDWIEQEQQGSGPEIVLADPDEVYDHVPAPSVVIIATASRLHRRDSETALSYGHDVLVEKPFTTGSEDARAVVEMATRGGRLVGVNRSFSFATYLHEAAEQFAISRLGAWNGRLDWADPLHEVRHGDSKSRDIWTPVASDLFPHILSICQVVFGEAPVIENIVVERGGRSLEIDARFRNGQLQIGLARESDHRRRHLFVSDGTHHLSLDFSEEPGVLIADDRRVPLESSWNRFPSPLRLSLGSFLNARAVSDLTFPNLGPQCLEGLETAKHLVDATRMAQVETIAHALPHQPEAFDDIANAVCSLFGDTADLMGEPLRQDDSCLRLARFVLDSLVSDDGMKRLASNDRAIAARILAAAGNG